MRLFNWFRSEEQVVETPSPEEETSGGLVSEPPNWPDLSWSPTDEDDFDRLVDQQDQELFHNGFVSEHTKRSFKKLR